MSNVKTRYMSKSIRKWWWQSIWILDSIFFRGRRQCSSFLLTWKCLIWNIECVFLCMQQTSDSQWRKYGNQRCVLHQNGSAILQFCNCFVNDFQLSFPFDSTMNPFFPPISEFVRISSKWSLDSEKKYIQKSKSVVNVKCWRYANCNLSLALDNL